MTVTQAVLRIEKAKNAITLFGSDPVGRKTKYHELAMLVHPDKNPGDKRASDAFAKLSRLYAGDKSPVAKLGKWEITATINAGDIADIYQSNDVAIKIARSPKDADLMERERFALKFLHAWDQGEEFKKYIPKVLDYFEASGRSTTVMTLCEKQLGLHEITGRISLDFRHVIWMVNRTLSALGFAHQRGIVHGAVLPPHLMFGPVNHSLSLIDWCYSTTMESKDHVPAKVKDWAPVYPAEVGRKMKATPATDIYMLFASLRAVGVVPPRRFKSLFEWCLAESPSARPSDAWQLQDRWRALAEEEYGPPKFVELVIPAN